MNGQLKYVCDECGDLHDDRYDAADCCRPMIRTTWVCESCGSENSDQTEADACCPPENPESPEAIRRQVAELEAAGQLWFKGF